MSGLPILGVEALRQKVRPQQQHSSFICSEAERRQEISLHQRIALPGKGDNRYARFGERLNVAMDRALARLKVDREIFGALPAVTLQFQQQREQAIRSVHRSDSCRELQAMSEFSGQQL